MMNRRYFPVAALEVISAAAIASAVPIGHCPGVKKLIETADAIVILRIDRHLSDFNSPTFYSTHECFIYQTLKGDIPENARINLRLLDTDASFATPYAHGSTHLMFLMKRATEDEPTEYRTITFKGAQILLSPLRHEREPEGKTLADKVRKLIKDAIVYQAKEHEKKQSFFKAMLGREEAAEHQARLAICLVEEPSVDLDAAELAHAPLLTDADIVSYDWQEHTIVLTGEGFKKLPTVGEIGVTGKPFVVLADGERCYLGAFWTGFSSIACPNPVIDVLRYKDNAISIQRAYPSARAANGDDPRADGRIRKVLAELRKLKNAPDQAIDSLKK